MCLTLSCLVFLGGDVDTAGMDIPEVLHLGHLELGTGS